MSSTLYPVLVCLCARAARFSRHHAQQHLHGGHGRQDCRVLQEDDDDAVWPGLGDAALCLLDREAARPLVLGEVERNQQQDLDEGTDQIND